MKPYLILYRSTRMQPRRFRKLFVDKIAAEKYAETLAGGRGFTVVAVSPREGDR